MRGLSQRELARELPRTGSNEISKYERGLQVPRTHTLYDITQALACTMDDLLNPPPSDAASDGQPAEPHPEADDRPAGDVVPFAGRRGELRRRSHA
jgi:transcriptional regulator with XRE-family HTH domain